MNTPTPGDLSARLPELPEPELMTIKGRAFTATQMYLFAIKVRDAALSALPAAGGEVCRVCGGGPGNFGVCLCGEHDYTTPQPSAAVLEDGGPPCSTHPDAPHGFNRNASHTEDRYVCDCEGWKPDAAVGAQGDGDVVERLVGVLDQLKNQAADAAIGARTMERQKIELGKSLGFESAILHIRAALYSAAPAAGKGVELSKLVSVLDGMTGSAESTLGDDDKESTFLPLPVGDFQRALRMAVATLLEQSPAELCLAAQKARDLLGMALMAPDGTRVTLHLARARQAHDSLAAALTRQPVAGDGMGAGEREELERLRSLVNTPELHDFTRGVVLEGAHQRERWGNDHDAGKEPQDWFWLVGYLAGKALRSHLDGNTDKALHHTITVAAACANWHGAILGTHNMRPGIDGEAALAAPAATPTDGGEGS